MRFEVAMRLGAAVSTAWFWHIIVFNDETSQGMAVLFTAFAVAGIVSGLCDIARVYRSSRRRGR